MTTSGDVDEVENVTVVDIVVGRVPIVVGSSTLIPFIADNALYKPEAAELGRDVALYEDAVLSPSGKDGVPEGINHSSFSTMLVNQSVFVRLVGFVFLASLPALCVVSSLPFFVVFLSCSFRCCSSCSIRFLSD
jgi:hypothetical protein